MWAWFRRLLNMQDLHKQEKSFKEFDEDVVEEKDEIVIMRRLVDIESNTANLLRSQLESMRYKKW